MATTFPDDQLVELERLYGPVQYAEEGGLPYLRIAGLQLPAGCSPEKTDALLCPAMREGYHSRLFFRDRVSNGKNPNWAPPMHILGSTWHVYSYQLGTLDLRLAQMVTMHLRGLR